MGKIQMGDIQAKFSTRLLRVSKNEPTISKKIFEFFLYAVFEMKILASSWI
jgi:hypothetical protein